MVTETEQETQYLTRKQVAKIVGVYERTVDRWIKDGKLKAIKFGESKNSMVRIHKTDLERFLQSRRGK